MIAPHMPPPFHHARTFAEELGIDVEANTPAAWFCLLVISMLSSARVGHAIALRSARVLIERGWTTPGKMAAASWEQRVNALDEGGYVRYDERTAAMLAQTAQMVVARYGGVLRRLRDEAGRDAAQERKLLKQFKGIGDVGANIVFREAQAGWPELYPFADERVLTAAKALGLPADANALAEMVRGRRQFARLVAALIRVHLERTHEQIRRAARGES
jgi:hypothetical protein